MMAELLQLEDHRSRGSNEPPPAWEFLPLALIVAPGIAWEEWTQLWTITSKIDKNSKFYLGDALRYGEATFPDQWTQVVDAKFMHQQRGALWVASRIAPAERRDTDLVSWSAHREVAALDDPKHRKKILDLAEAKKLTTAEVKAAIWRLFPEAKAAKPGRRGRPPKDPNFHVENHKPQTEQVAPASENSAKVVEPKASSQDTAEPKPGPALVEAEDDLPIGDRIPDDYRPVPAPEPPNPTTIEEAIDLLTSLPAGALPDNIMGAILMLTENRLKLRKVLLAAQNTLTGYGDEVIAEHFAELAEAVEAARV